VAVAVAVVPGDDLSEKPGNVGEFDRCRGTVKKNCLLLTSQHQCLIA